MLGLPLLGRGFCSDVYAWGDGRVVKLFHGRVPLARVAREFRATVAVYRAGLPVPAAYEVVEIDGRQGLVLERIDGPSLLVYVQRRPWALFEAIALLARLHAKIHSCAAPAELPAQRDWLAAGIDAAVNLSASVRQAARRRLARLPDGDAICHGDFHPENVLLTARGPVIIDWDTATRGHPAGDVACTTRLIRLASLPPWAPRYAHWLLRCTRPLLHQAYLRHYCRLRPGTRNQLAAWESVLAATRARHHDKNESHHDNASGENTKE